MWWWWWVGCGSWGPEAAVREAKRALDAGDRAAFEAIVDVEAVVPEVADTCVRLGGVADLADQQFTGRAPLAAGLVSAFVTAAVQSPDQRAAWVQQFQATFPHLPTDTCPALVLDPDRATYARIDEDHATASLPVEVDGHLGAWTLALERREGDWHVAHVEGGALVEAWRVQELALAKARAAALVGGLADGAPHDDWTAAAFYVARHPEEVQLERAYRAALAPLEAAPSLLPTTESGFFKPRGLFRNRHVGTWVENPGPGPVRGATVRFALEDAEGQRVAGGGGLDALVVETGPLAPGERRRVVSPASGVTWPEAFRVVATVVAVSDEAGRWTVHPAVEAGAWSRFPTDQPVR